MSTSNPRDRITLNGIKRRGDRWLGREAWTQRQVRIFSDEHNAWWRANGEGYTVLIADAGVYDFADAFSRTKHCGPEKKIIFEFHEYR